MCAMNPRLLRPKASGFNPKSIAGLRLWLDADDSSTITLNGSDVSEWRDKSGSNRHASQATAASQPAYTSNAINGRPALTFGSGGIKILATTSFASSQPAVIFVIAKYTSGTGHVLDGITGDRHYLYAAAGGGIRYGSSGAVANGSADWGANTRLLSFRLDGTSSFIRINGAQDANANGGTGNITAGYRIGAFSPTAAGWVGLIAEILIYGSLTSSDIQSVEKYLSKKWGVTLA